jgi:drug/metabolite transporter superfamily protein YnfA
MAFAILLYVVFTLLSITGTFLVVDHFRTRRLAVVLTLVVLALYAGLAAALVELFRGSGL